MTDYEYEILQKKRTASGARHKKGGSRSKKCVLPSDYFSKKQIKQLSGEVKQMNINQKMTWREFKLLPLDLREEHLRWILEQFGVTATQISSMFEISPTYFSHYLKQSGIRVAFPRKKKKPTPAQEFAWLRFCGVSEEPPVKHLPAEALPVQPPVPTPGRPCPVLSFDGFSLRFSGQIDIDAVTNSLRMILGGPTGRGKLTLTFEAEEKLQKAERDVVGFCAGA